VAHEEHAADTTNSDNLVGKINGKQPLIRSRRKWDNDTKV
jgi:hypothetical protein